MLNLHDAKEVYQQVLDKAGEKISKLRQKQEDYEKVIYKQAKDINNIWKRIVKEGRTPYEDCLEPVMY